MKIMGLSDFSRIFGGMPEIATRRAAEASSAAKLSIFLHKNEQTIYKNAQITLNLASRLWIREFAG